MPLFKIESPLFSSSVMDKNRTEIPIGSVILAAISEPGTDTQKVRVVSVSSIHEENVALKSFMRAQLLISLNAEEWNNLAKTQLPLPQIVL